MRALELLTAACCAALLALLVMTVARTLGSDVDRFGNEHPSPAMELVVARYAEDLDWLAAPMFNNASCTVYNKGPPLRPQDVPAAVQGTLVNRPNVGRCDETFLRHIVERYDSLADVTVFLPASCMDAHKAGATAQVLRLARETGTTVLRGKGYTDVRRELYDFQLDAWAATNARNKAANAEARLQPAPVRPFGAWFDANFPGLRKTPVRVVCFYGIFAVHRDHILQHPRRVYEALLSQLQGSSNPEVGHYMERSWGALFYPYPDACVHTD